MTLIIEEKKAWWKRKEFYGSVIASTIPILTLFPTHTTAWKVGISLNALAGGLLTFFGVMRGYKANNLYKPIDDAITFVLPEGLRREK